MNDNLFTDSLFEELRDLVKAFVDEKRYRHILSVEKKAEEIGAVFLPSKIEKLKTAAILHDITKSLKTSEQYEICEKYGYPLSATVSPKILHAITAPLVISNELSSDFPVLNDPEILNAVRWHATGHNDMTLFESVIYLADYIEDTREYNDCKRIREFYDTGLTDDHDDNILHLYKTMAICFRYTINDLISNDSIVDLNTVEAWNYFQKLINDSEKGKTIYEI